MMHLSLKKKFILPTLSLIVVCMIVSSTISYTQSKSALKEALIDQQTQIVESMVKFLFAWVSDRKLEIAYWKELDLYQNALLEDEAGQSARKTAETYMVKLKRNDKYYEDICIADLSGTIIVSSSPETSGKINVKEREYFKRSIEGGTFISDIIESKRTGHPVAAISAPIEVHGRIMGILFSVIDISSFSGEFIDPITVGKSGYGFLFNQEGLIAAHPDKKEILSLNINQFDFGREMVKQENGTLTYTFNKEEKIVVFRKERLTGWTVGVGGLTREIFAPMIRLRTVSIFISLVIICLTGILIYVITHSVVKPINHVVSGLKDVAEGEGDLTKRLAVPSRDEVGELARWFNTFIEKIRGIIAEVAQNAGQLSGASREFATVAADMAAGADEMTTKAATVSDAGQKMSDSMSTVADVMDQATGNINMVAASTEEMETTINEIAMSAETARDITQKAVDQTGTVSGQMGTLGEAAQEIEKVIGTITDISAQVNLLALNATIEAARAGEAGKGFAVVANEIKELAMQTSNATEEIRQRVAAIQGSTESTVREMSGITDVINNVNDIITSIAAAVEEQSQATREISGNLSQASTNMNDVNSNVSESSDSSRAISSDINDLTQTIRDMAESSSKINANSSSLFGMADTLNEMVGRFKV